MLSMEKRQRQGKERKIMVVELVESMECVKDVFYAAFHTPNKKIAIGSMYYIFFFLISFAFTCFAADTASCKLILVHGGLNKHRPLARIAGTA
jgi:hypothetical protein